MGGNRMTIDDGCVRLTFGVSGAPAKPAVDHAARLEQEREAILAEVNPDNLNPVSRQAVFIEPK